MKRPIINTYLVHHGNGGCKVFRQPTLRAKSMDRLLTTDYPPTDHQGRSGSVWITWKEKFANTASSLGGSGRDGGLV